MSKSNEEKSANNKERSIFGGCLYFVMTEWRLMKDEQVAKKYRSLDDEVDPTRLPKPQPPQNKDSKRRDTIVTRYTERNADPPSKKTAETIGRAIRRVINSRYSNINALEKNGLDLLRLYEHLVQRYKSLKDLRDGIKNDSSSSEHKPRLSNISQLAQGAKDIRTFIFQHQNDYFKDILEELAQFSEDLILYAHDVHMKVKNGSNPIEPMSRGDSERKNNPSQQEATVIRQERCSGGGTVGKMVGPKKPFDLNDKLVSDEWVSVLQSAQSKNEFFDVVWKIYEEMVSNGVSLQAIIKKLVVLGFTDKDRLELAAERDPLIIMPSMYFVVIMRYCLGIGCFDRSLFEDSLRSNIKIIENALNDTEIST